MPYYSSHHNHPSHDTTGPHHPTSCWDAPTWPCPTYPGPGTWQASLESVGDGQVQWEDRTDGGDGSTGHGSGKRRKETHLPRSHTHFSALRGGEGEAPSLRWVFSSADDE